MTGAIANDGLARVAVVGMGQWGRNLVRNFAELGALAAVCDADAACADKVEALAPGTPFTTDYAALLRDAALPAVVLATPAVRHFDMAAQALRAGKDVYVEKPLAMRVDEGRELVALAADTARILMVGHILRYHPAVIRLGELIREGALGRINYIYSNRLNIGKIRTEENILWSFAPHDISVMLGLLNEEPIAVSCEGGAYLSSEVFDVTLSQFTFPSGVRGHIHVSWLHPFKEQRLVVIGSEKMAVFEDTAPEKLRVYPHRVEWHDRIPTAVKADAEVVAFDADEPLRRECEHFLDCVRTRRRPLTDGAEGLRVLKVLDACQAALAGAGARRTPPAAVAFKAHETAVVDAGARIGAGTRIWHFSHVMSGARIGAGCSLGQNVNVAGDTVIGNNVKIQNNVSIYAGARIEDDVFLGPSCVLTNVTNPRSQINRHDLYEPTHIKRGATIGANATLVCGTTIGCYAFVGAGAVVTRDVPDYGLVMGNPAKRKGWMSRHGQKLPSPDAQGIRVCPESGYRYREIGPGRLRCLDLDENTPLPESQRVGHKRYDAFKD